MHICSLQCVVRVRGERLLVWVNAFKNGTNNINSNTSKQTQRLRSLRSRCSVRRLEEDDDDDDEMVSSYNASAFLVHKITPHIRTMCALPNGNEIAQHAARVEVVFRDLHHSRPEWEGRFATKTAAPFVQCSSVPYPEGDVLNNGTELFRDSDEWDCVNYGISDFFLD